MTSTKALKKAVALVSETYFGETGRWLCQSFEAINRRLFDETLPQPLITVETTRWGRCPGCSDRDRNQAPHIIIHPTLFGEQETADKPPCGLKNQWLGKRLVFDVLNCEWYSKSAAPGAEKVQRWLVAGRIPGVPA